MLGKKGMSPLIITILLIALAVALGVMIMSWSSKGVQPTEVSCDAVSLEIQKAFGAEMLCFNEEESKLRLIVRNSGTNTIDSLTYRRITPDFKTKDNKLPNSYLGPGKIYESEIGFQNLEKIHIEIVPSVVVEGSEVLCTEQAIVRDSVPSCPS